MRPLLVIGSSMLLAACLPGAVETGATPPSGCVADKDCPTDFYCVGGACQLLPGDCSSDHDCLPGHFCLSQHCAQGCSLVPCDTGEVCDQPSQQCVTAGPDAGGGSPDAGGGTPDAGGQPDAGGHPDAGTPDAGSSPSFSLSASPGSMSGTGSVTISSTPSNGFTGSIGLSVSGAPSGGSAGLSATSISQNGSASLSLTPGTAAAGTYSLDVAGNGGGLTRHASVAWTVGSVATPGYSLSLSPTSATGAATSTLTITGTNGFAGTVALSVSGAPSGSTATLSKSSQTGSGTATLTLTPGTGAAGTYTLTVTGTSGVTSHTATLSWTIAAVSTCTPDTWANWSKTMLSNNCRGCHSWAGTYSSVQSRSSDCQTRISSGNMPKGSSLSASDKQRILKWFSCGLPQ